MCLQLGKQRRARLTAPRGHDAPLLEWQQRGRPRRQRRQARLARHRRHWHAGLAVVVGVIDIDIDIDIVVVVVAAASVVADRPSVELTDRCGVADIDIDIDFGVIVVGVGVAAADVQERVERRAEQLGGLHVRISKGFAADTLSPRTTRHRQPCAAARRGACRAHAQRLCRP